MTRNGALAIQQSFLDRFALGRKLVAGWGKARRFYLIRFRSAHVAHWQRRRRGECVRCGGCCAIMFRCPHLKHDNVCKVYEHRFRQCGHFPIDPRDLRYLHTKCGFWFESEEGASHGASTDTLRD